MNNRKTYSLRLALVVLLLAMNLLRQLFPDGWTLGFWALAVNVIILFVIVGEIVVRWWLGRRRAADEDAIWALLAHDPAGASKTIEQISVATRIRPHKAKAVLQRLRDKHRVDSDHQDKWRKVSF